MQNDSCQGIDEVEFLVNRGFLNIPVFSQAHKIVWKLVFLWSKYFLNKSKKSKQKWKKKNSNNPKNPWKNLKISKIVKNGQKIKKSVFFIYLFIYFLPKKIAMLLVLPFEEISIRPELSSDWRVSTPRFRIQGGYPERDIHTQEQEQNSIPSF